MEKEIFIKKLAETIDCEDELTMNTLLEDILEWDSLGIVSFIAMASTDYNKKIKMELLMKAITINDLYNLVK